VRLKECIESGRYEEAFNVSFESFRQEINKAHIRLLSRYRSSSETRELLNFAKSKITNESKLEKGRRLIRIGQKEKALEYLTSALKVTGEPDDYLLLGQALEQTWRIEASLPYFERAVELRGNASDQLWLGTTLERLDRYDEALKCFSTAIKLRGEADDYRAKGSVLLKMKKIKEAKKCLEKAVSLGDKLSSVHLLQKIKIKNNKEKVKKVIDSISGFISKVKTSLIF